MLALALWLNILLSVAAFGIIVGVPLWMVLRHPDRHPAENRRRPAYLRLKLNTVPAAAPTRPATATSVRRELAGTAAR